jgi:DNA-nicking Smr family endonuclease
MTRRRLSDDERTLWRGFTRAITPLRKSARKEFKEFEEEVSHPGAALERGGAAPSPPPLRGRGKEGIAAAQKPAPTLPPLAPLGRRLQKRVARGAHSIDGRLDLHGMTQAQAHDALLGFLRTAQARGGKLVLVITGKGAGGAGNLDGERGVLKRRVPMWLKLPEFRRRVVGFESAGPRHGGEGALYIRLRKPPRNS